MVKLQSRLRVVVSCCKRFEMLFSLISVSIFSMYMTMTDLSKLCKGAMGGFIESVYIRGEVGVANIYEVGEVVIGLVH